ncbi:YHYH protein [Candidatus Kaiserbacteria bacterium]|nr:YHYH protein [Candidatus Kaiserbacteria bacterium]
MDFFSVFTTIWLGLSSLFGGVDTPHGVTHTHENGETHTHEISIEKQAFFVEEDGYGSAVITTDGQYRYITSDGLPDHETGAFPNRGNPNAISEQSHSYRVPRTPTYTETTTAVRIAGVALNGIPLEPGTAETYDEDISWSIEAFDADGVGGLGIDWSNAHVQPDGTYHYHAVPEGLLEHALEEQSGDLIHLAWAADGFPIYFSQSHAYQSSWQIKEGVRPDGPGGVYDGTYTEDFEYIPDSGDLDACNGMFIEGEYVYLFTDTFPYIQRCVHGVPDESFMQRGREGAQQQGRIPPQEATNACEGEDMGSVCSFTTPRGNVSGMCRAIPDGSLSCVPQ